MAYIPESGITFTHGHLVINLVSVGPVATKDEDRYVAEETDACLG